MAFEVVQQNMKKNETMPESYYQRGINGFISQQGLALESAAQWRKFAIGLLLISLVSISAAIYFAMRSTIVPFIVEVDNRSGAVISTSKVLAKTEATTKQTEYFIWQLIRKARTLPKDVIVYENNWNELYAFLDNASSQKMNDMAIREGHKEKLRNGVTTMLSLRTITPLAGRDDTFNVRWAEVNYDTSGKKQAEYELEAFFSVEQMPLDEKTMYINPLGIKIKDFTMSQVQ